MAPRGWLTRELIYGLFGLLLGAIVLFAPGPSAVAQSATDARYSFASAQSNDLITVPIGGVGSGHMFFYNIDGNRITHVRLELVSPPAGLEAALDPPARETVISVDGQQLTIQQNLQVEPGEVFASAPTAPAEGWEAVYLPNRGHVLARTAALTVKAPANARPGDTAQLTVQAEASWLGQTGAAALKQSREFTFTAQFVVADPSKETTGVVAAQTPPGPDWRRLVVDSLPAALIGAALALLLMAIYDRLQRRRAH